MLCTDRQGGVSALTSGLELSVQQSILLLVPGFGIQC